MPLFSTQLVLYHANMYWDRNEFSSDSDVRVCIDMGGGVVAIVQRAARHASCKYVLG